jgi:hypothetical protein
LALDVADGTGFAFLTWWQAPRAIELLQAARFGQPFVDPNPLLTMLTQIVAKLVGLPALASIAVAWHRLLLKDERPGAGVYLRLDGVVAGYAVLAFWLGLITLAPSYVGVMLQSMPAHGLVSGVQFLAGVGTITAFFVVARLSLVLPGKALGRDHITFGDRLESQQGQHLADALGLFLLHFAADGA